MNQLSLLMTLLLCTFLLPGAYAVTILECVDDAGNSTFQDHCPPGTTSASQRDIKTGAQEPAKTTAINQPEAAAATGTGNADITFYTTSTDCDACLVIKGVLDSYGANYTTKDISTDLAVRQELKDKTGGTGTSVSVPTIIFNGQVIAGYSKDPLIKALEGAGYKKAGAAAESAPQAETEAETETNQQSEQPAETEEIGEGNEG